MKEVASEDGVAVVDAKSEAPANRLIATGTPAPTCKRQVVILSVVCVVLGATLPSAVLGTIMATERQCVLRVNTVTDQCHDTVLHAVTAAAYDQVSYAEARYLDRHNLTSRHIDFLNQHASLQPSPNAPAYSARGAFNFSTVGSSRRALADAPSAGANLYVPGDAATVGQTFYVLKNGYNYDNSERMGAMPGPDM